MQDRALSRRYAQALYESAKASGEEKLAAEELGKAARALSEHMAAFRHPLTPAKDKKTRLRDVLGESVSKRTRNFLELLIEKKRFALLPQMAADMGHIYDEGRGVVHAQVRAAAPLSDADKKALSAKLGGYVGKTVELDVKTDPELLAGAVVRLGDWVFDGSLKGRLRTMRGRLAS